jgi:hypothetical protein
MQHQFVGGRLTNASTTTASHYSPIPDVVYRTSRLEAFPSTHRVADIGSLERNTTTKLDYPRWKSYEAKRGAEKTFRERDMPKEDRDFKTTMGVIFKHPNVKFSNVRNGRK